MGVVKFDLSDSESNSGPSKRGYAPSEGYAQSNVSTTARDVDGSPGESTSREIAGRESQHVRRLRILLILVLFLAAVAVSATIFLLTSGAEEEEFEAEFNGVAAKVVESFTEIVGEKVSAVSALSAAATSFASAQNMTWPFVTLNDFVYRTQSTVTLADCLLVEFLHVVTDEERARWEMYTMTNQDWFIESLQYQSEANEVFEGEYFEGDLTQLNLPFIYQFGTNPDGTVGIVPDPGPGPYTASKLAYFLWLFGVSFQSRSSDSLLSTLHSLAAFARHSDLAQSQ